jgi:hypothetical protein
MQTAKTKLLMKTAGKTSSDRIRKQTVSLGLGNIPLREIIYLAQFSWFGHVVRMGGRGGDLRVAWQVGTKGKRPNGGPTRLGEGYRRF